MFSTRLLISCVLLVPISFSIASSLKGKELRVTAYVCEARSDCFYLSWKENSASFQGNDRFQGLLLDLMKDLSHQLGFTFTIQEVKDHRYGGFTNATGWNGMIGELVRGEADVALADLSITKAREQDVDFSLPYMSLGLGVLIHSKMGHRLNNLEDIVKADDVSIGCYQGGSTNAYFQHVTKIPVHKELWAKMSLGNSVMTDSNSQGVQRVLEEEGAYAYIMESPSIDYITARNCNLKKLGGTFAGRNYGLALPQGSPYREELSLGVLALQESGRMEQLVHHWIQGSDVQTCPDHWGSVFNMIQGMF